VKSIEIDGNLLSKAREETGTPEVTELRKAIRACLLTGEDYRGIMDILATEDALLEK
jgi:hypothetical protein